VIKVLHHRPDAGRPGYYNVGIPLSGALDQYALRVGNLLVGNDEGAAVLEASLLAPELVFRAPAVIAITGAEATPKVNGEARPRNESFAVKADDKLTFDFMKTGARCYVAVAGGIEVPVVLDAVRPMVSERWADFQAVRLRLAMCCRSASRARVRAPAASSRAH
jgi:allophanate hydrolase subunit 2